MNHRIWLGDGHLIHKSLLLAVFALSVSLGWAEDREQLSRAQQALQKRDHAEAEQQFRRCLEQATTDVERQAAYRGLCSTHRALQRHADALQYALPYHELVKKNRNAKNSDVLASALAIADDYQSLHRYGEAEAILKTTLADFSQQPLDPQLKLKATLHLAVIMQRQDEADQAKRHWQQGLDQGREAIDRIAKRLPGYSRDQRPFYLTAQATCLAALSRTGEALSVLEKLLKEQTGQAQARIRRDTLVEMARHHVLEKNRAEAADCLRQAVAAERDSTPHNPNDLGTLLSRLAAAEAAAGRENEATEHWQEAASELEIALRLAMHDEDRADCQRYLCTVYANTGQLSRALAIGKTVVAYFERTRGENHPRVAEGRAVLGQLYLRSGDYQTALPYVLEDVRRWRASKPDDPAALAAALSNLGLVKKAIGDLPAARLLFEEALALRRTHLAASDLELAASHNSLASVLASEGKYAQAVQHYERALSALDKTSGSDARRGETLLNLAVVYKSQRQYDQALAKTREAFDLRQRSVEPDALELARYCHTLSALHRELGLSQKLRDKPGEALEQFQNARSLSLRAIEICQQHKQPRHEDVANGLNQLAALAQLAGREDLAEQHWSDALSIYRERGFSVMQIRTLNRLGVLAFHRDELMEAEECFHEALEVIGRGGGLQDRFSALFNLACVRWRRSEWHEAIELLREAVELVETPRGEYVGREDELAGFFASFSQAFDLLVDCLVETGQLNEAFAVAERARARTFLDRLRLCGVDLRESLPPDQQQLRQLEHELREKLNVLRAQTTVGDKTEDASATVNFQRQSERLQKEYAQVWNQIRNASPVYRQLLTRDQQLAPLAEIQSQILPADDLMLAYYVGFQRSYLWVVDTKHPIEIFPLHLRTQVKLTHERVEIAQRPHELERALIGVVETPKGELIQDRESLLGTGSLSMRRLLPLASDYSRTLINRRFVGRDSRAALALAEVLLPDPVRRIIAQRKPSHLVILPHGPLQSIPFEALLLADGESPRFLIDDPTFPPISYAPSANVLFNLVRRPPVGADVPTLLAVGNPAYNEQPVVGLGRAIPRLLNSAAECQRGQTAFAAKFGKQNVQLLLDEQATEINFLAHVRGRRYLHVAAHGLLDERNDNLFGALALAPNQHPENDGFLEIREIQSLPLQGCELAILSACQSNVSTARPQEPGPSLAQAFLVAGTRRVVASHWNVEDASTSELIGGFLEDVAARVATRSVVDHAQALTDARRKIRATTDWSSPYYWAPFVLVGPAD